MKVEKSVRVAASPETAFRVFTRDMSRWWPLQTHKIGAVEARDAVIEPFEGGRWFERGVDGSECEWGRVLEWQPPRRLVLSWQISPTWQFDPELLTRVEVTFTPDGDGTRVDLVHRDLDAFGPAAEQMRGVFDSEGGWGGLIAAYAAATR